MQLPFKCPLAQLAPAERTAQPVSSLLKPQQVLETASLLAHQVFNTDFIEFFKLIRVKLASAAGGAGAGAAAAPPAAAAAAPPAAAAAKGAAKNASGAGGKGAGKAKGKGKAAGGGCAGGNQAQGKAQTQRSHARDLLMQRY
jgi:hypothetical protein